MITRTTLYSLGFTGIAANAFAENPGLPQMDPTWFANQLVWLGISFVVLYGVVARVIVPSVSTVLATRKDTIAQAIAAAETYQRDAEEARVNAQSSAHNVHEKVTLMMQEAAAKSAETSAKTIAKLNHDLDAKINHALLEVERAVAAAQPAMTDASNDVARVLAEKLLGQTVDAALVRGIPRNAA